MQYSVPSAPQKHPSAAIAELFSHATGGDPAVNRVTQESHLPFDGGSAAPTHPATSQGESPAGASNVSVPLDTVDMHVQTLFQLLHSTLSWSRQAHLMLRWTPLLFQSC